MNWLERLNRWDLAFRTWDRRRKRNPSIRSALPEALDLLALIMQAGLHFQVALQHYVETAPAGPLREEFCMTFEEIQLNGSFTNALRRLAVRVGEEDLQETVRALIQGLTLGSSIAPVLKMQAVNLRRRRALRAEKRAAQAPLKLLFPLMIFIFPTIFIVLLAPMATSFLQGGFQ